VFRLSTAQGSIILSASRSCSSLCVVPFLPARTAIRQGDHATGRRDGRRNAGRLHMRNGLRPEFLEKSGAPVVHLGSVSPRSDRWALGYPRGPGRCAIGGPLSDAGSRTWRLICTTLRSVCRYCGSSRCSTTCMRMLLLCGPCLARRRLDILAPRAIGPPAAFGAIDGNTHRDDSRLSTATHCGRTRAWRISSPAAS